MQLNWKESLLLGVNTGVIAVSSHIFTSFINPENANNWLHVGLAGASGCLLGAYFSHKGFPNFAISNKN